MGDRKLHYPSTSVSKHCTKCVKTKKLIWLNEVDWALNPQVHVWFMCHKGTAVVVNINPPVTSSPPSSSVHHV